MTFILLALTFIGCRKENLPINEETASQSLAATTGNGSGCPVTAFDYYVGFTDEHQVDRYIYKDGLVAEWKTWYGMDYQIEYGEDGNMAIARGYDAGNLVYTIHFFYEKDRVVREVWYEGTTAVVGDEMIYTYDHRGLLVKGESPVLDYYTENVYTPAGDLESWTFYMGGVPVTSGHYTYNEKYKSPLRNGTPGVEYNFPYSNSTFGLTKWWYSSEKIVVYDETGAPTVSYDQDPAQTQWQFSTNRMLEYVGYVDGQTGTTLSVGFEYENCLENKGNAGTRAARADQSGKRMSHRTLLQRSPSQSIKEKVREWRVQLKAQNNS